MSPTHLQGKLKQQHWVEAVCLRLQVLSQQRMRHQCLANLVGCQRDLNTPQECLLLLTCLQVFSMGDIRPANVADKEARAALVWILGQFGQHIQGKDEATSG